MIIILCFIAAWYYPGSFPFVIILMVDYLKRNIAYVDAVITTQGLMSYKQYQHNSNNLSKIRTIKAIEYKKKYYFAIPGGKN